MRVYQRVPQKSAVRGKNLLISKTGTRLWFQIFFIFTPTWGNDPIWLIFFKWVVQPPTRQEFIQDTGSQELQSFESNLVLLSVVCHPSLQLLQGWQNTTSDDFWWYFDDDPTELSFDLWRSSWATTCGICKPSKKEQQLENPGIPRQPPRPRGVEHRRPFSFWKMRERRSNARLGWGSLVSCRLPLAKWRRVFWTWAS